MIKDIYVFLSGSYYPISDWLVFESNALKVNKTVLKVGEKVTIMGNGSVSTCLNADKLDGYEASDLFAAETCRYTLCTVGSGKVIPNPDALCAPTNFGLITVAYILSSPKIPGSVFHEVCYRNGSGFTCDLYPMRGTFILPTSATSGCEITMRCWYSSLTTIACDIFIEGIRYEQVEVTMAPSFGLVICCK